MPGPPPAGVSSTLRWRSVAESRMSRASSAHRPEASALPARLTPSGPGNMSGNSVRMVARQVISNRSYNNRSRKRRNVVAFNFLGQFYHDAAGRKVDRRHHGIGERQQHRRALRWCDLDDVAGAEIMDRGDAAERFVCSIHRGEPDQIGMVIFVVVGL